MDSEKNLGNRILFMMKYDLSKTSEENSIFLSEQKLTSTDIKFIETDNPNQYPNFCRYPDRAILPGKNEMGISGIEAIPKEYCCYPIPMPESRSGGVSYIFLPQDAEIEFWDETKYNHLFKNTLKLNKKEISDYIDYYSKLFPYGSVFSFDISGLTYTSWMKKERDSKFGFFNWFFTDNERKQPYPKIEWTDPRNEWDRIVDKWGNIAQWASAAAFFISGFFTQGAGWLLLAEILTEGTLGLILAERNLEKGENISATFDLIFGSTPFLKTNKFFTGLDQESVKSVIRSMRRVGLTKNSTPQQIIQWYQSLGDAEQLVWSKMIKISEQVSENKLKQILGQGLDAFKNEIKSNPNLLKKINWYQKVNTKEFTLGVFLAIAGVLVETFYGEELNEREKLKLTTIVNNSEKISTQLAKELELNLLANADKLKNIINSKTADSFIKNLTHNAAKSSLEYINSQNKKIVEDGGGTWIEYERDETNPLENEVIDAETLKKLESEGYKLESSLTKEEWNNAHSPRTINNNIYWKIKE